jgi:hypothetical protein
MKPTSESRVAFDAYPTEHANSRAAFQIKVLLVSVAIWASTLFVGGGVLLGADFGVPAWILVLALLWLATVGLATTAGVLLAVSVWGVVPGLNGLGAFLCCAALASLAFEIAFCQCTGRLVSWLIQRKS